jgi:hypothetical protein
MEEPWAVLIAEVVTYTNNRFLEAANIELVDGSGTDDCENVAGLYALRKVRPSWLLAAVHSTSLPNA